MIMWIAWAILAPTLLLMGLAFMWATALLFMLASLAVAALRDAVERKPR